jgi:hypothetical protein
MWNYIAMPTNFAIMNAIMFCANGIDWIRARWKIKFAHQCLLASNNGSIVIEQKVILICEHNGF